MTKWDSFEFCADFILRFSVTSKYWDTRLVKLIYPCKNVYSLIMSTKISQVLHCLFEANLHHAAVAKIYTEVAQLLCLCIRTNRSLQTLLIKWIFM